jgi:transposase
MVGRRVPPPADLVVALKDLPPPPANPFYDRLNRILDEAGFDAFAEDLCRPYYAEGVGRPSVPPGVYFRMLFLGYFEGFDSQRAIDWRCADSRSLQAFLGLPPHETTPDHSSLTKIRQRLPQSVHEQVFAFVLKLAEDKGLVHGKTVGIDSTFLEANASLKTLVRREGGNDYKSYLRKLAAEAGIEDPSDEELRRFDRKRPDKTLSNEDWVSPIDPDSRIARMKDHTTHLAYKAEHVVDLSSDVVLAAPIYPADQSDMDTLVESLTTAQVNLIRAESEATLEAMAAKEAPIAAGATIEEAVADKGYHKTETLADCAALGVRTYIPEPDRPWQRVWSDKPAEWQQAYRGNRRRLRGRRSKRLQRLRSEKVERTFAHICETGRARRTWLRGLIDIGKRYAMQVAAHNLGIILRAVFGRGTPRSLQGVRPSLAMYLYRVFACGVVHESSLSAARTWLQLCRCQCYVI